MAVSDRKIMQAWEKDYPVFSCQGCKANMNQYFFWRNYSYFGNMRTAKTGAKVSLLCKACTKEFYYKLLEKQEGDIAQAMLELCSTQDFYFDEKLIRKLIKDIENQKSNKEYNNLPKEEKLEFPDCYLSIITDKKNPLYIDKNFYGQIKNFTTSISRGVEEDSVEVILTKEDKKNRADIISVFLKDPYKDEPVEIRSELYTKLSLMIDSSMANDLMKQNAALSIVQCFRRIEEYDEAIRSFMTSPEDIAKHGIDIKTLSELRKTEQAIAQQLGKENGLMEKYASAKTKGSGTLTAAMRDMEDSHYDNSLVNLYDIKTSASMQQAAEISASAIFRQLTLTSDEYAKMVEEQARDLQKIISEKEALEEELRIVKGKITKQELIEELIKELKDKNLSTDEINELLKLEINSSIFLTVPTEDNTSE